MKKACRDIIDHLAEGEPFGPEHEQHLSRCPTCARTLETSDLIRATTQRRNQVPPRPGFANRAAAGALQRAARRRRIGGIGLIGATLAAGAATFAFFSMQPKEIDLKRPRTMAAASASAVDDTPTDMRGVDELLDLADTEGSMALSADWSWLNEPLTGERLLAEHLDEADDKSDEDEEQP